MHRRCRLILRWSHRLKRQATIAIVAMVLVAALAGFDEWSSRTNAPKVQISGTVTQWNTLRLAGEGNTVNFRVGSFPFDLSIEATELQLLAKHGITEPLDVGSQVEAIVVKREVVAARDQANRGAAEGPAVAVLALRVNGQPMFGAPEAFRLRRSITTWPYLLLASAFGAALFFGNRRWRRRR
jgi:hypothetical protein